MNISHYAKLISFLKKTVSRNGNQEILNIIEKDIVEEFILNAPDRVQRTSLNITIVYNKINDKLVAMNTMGEILLMENLSH